jgi:hypothetical protein
MKLQKIDTANKDQKSPKQAIGFLLSFILLIVIINTFFISNSQQFANLAHSFLNLKLYFLHPIGNQTQNPVYYKGKEFFDDGPLPAIILMPFEALFKLFHLFFYQGYLQWILIILTLNIIYKIAQLIGFKKYDALLLAFTFILGSVYVGVAINSSSWYFAQVITTYLVFLIIYEYLTQKRWWLLGTLSAFVLLSRVSAFAIVFLLILDILFNNRSSIKAKLTNMIKLSFPVLLAGILIGLYNYLRFGDPLNGGYLYQAIDQTARYSRSKGLFSLKHIPFNFYHLVFGTPIINTPNSNNWIANFPYFENNPLGLSIFITSPYLIFLFYQSRKIFYQKDIIFLLISAFVGLIIVLTYFGVGTYQFGYRYSLDFLPEIFTVFMLIYYKTKQSLTFGMKFLFLLTIAFNFYLILSFI